MKTTTSERPLYHFKHYTFNTCLDIPIMLLLLDPEHAVNIFTVPHNLSE